MNAAFNRLLAAAQALLEARANGMVTSEEWDGLECAVAAAEALVHDDGPSLADDRYPPEQSGSFQEKP